VSDGEGGIEGRLENIWRVLIETTTQELVIYYFPGMDRGTYARFRQRYQVGGGWASRHAALVGKSPPWVGGGGRELCVVSSSKASEYHGVVSILASYGTNSCMEKADECGLLRFRPDILSIVLPITRNGDLNSRYKSSIGCEL